MLQNLSSAAVVIGALRVNSDYMLCIFACFSLSAVFFFQIYIHSVSGIISLYHHSVNQFGSRSGPDIMSGPDLGPNCLQRLSGEDTNR